MKPLTFAISVAVLALPLSAADQPKSSTTTTSLSAPAAPQQVDSPMVRAAKATKRLNKKPGMVITNETLLRSGGQLGVGSQEMQSVPLPRARTTTAPPLPKVSNSGACCPNAAKAKSEAEAKQRAIRQTADDYYGESDEPRQQDPAMQEHQLQKMTAPPPSTQPPSRPPHD